MFKGEPPRGNWYSAAIGAKEIRERALDNPVVVSEPAVSIINGRGPHIGVSIRVVPELTGKQVMDLVKGIHAPIELIAGEEVVPKPTV